MNRVLLLLAFPAMFLTGCTTIRTEHKIDAHIVLDVNLRIQRELDTFFGDLDAASASRDFKEPASTKD